MGYGNYNRGNYGGGNGGYQQNNYNNGGGYQKPAPQPVDINAEINARIDFWKTSIWKRMQQQLRNFLKEDNKNELIYSYRYRMQLKQED